MALLNLTAENLRVANSSKFSISTKVQPIYTFYAPFAPKEISYGMTGITNDNVERPERKPVTTINGKALKTLSMTLYVANKEIQEPITKEIAILKKLSESPRIVIIEYDEYTKGDWNITSFEVQSLERNEIDNEITRANFVLMFTENVDFNSIKVDLTPTSNVPKTYIVKAGESLYTIAQKVYSDPSRWLTIAKANGLKSADLRSKVGKPIKLL